MDEILVSHYFTLTFKDKMKCPEAPTNKLFRNLAKYTKTHLVGDYWCDIQKSRLKRTEKKVYHIHGWFADVEGKHLQDKTISKMLEYAWLESHGSKAEVCLYDYSKRDGNLVYNFAHEKIIPNKFWSPRLSKCKKRTCPICRKGSKNHRIITRYKSKATNVLNRVGKQKPQVKLIVPSCVEERKNEKNNLSSLVGSRKNLS